MTEEIKSKPRAITATNKQYDTAVYFKQLSMNYILESFSMLVSEIDGSRGAV